MNREGNFTYESDSDANPYGTTVSYLPSFYLFRFTPFPKLNMTGNTRATKIPKTRRKPRAKKRKRKKKRSARRPKQQPRRKRPTSASPKLPPLLLLFPPQPPLPPPLPPRSQNPRLQAAQSEHHTPARPTRKTNTPPVRLSHLVIKNLSSNVQAHHRTQSRAPSRARSQRRTLLPPTPTPPGNQQPSPSSAVRTKRTLSN